jgi:Cu+-exporting ATPase
VSDEGRILVGNESLLQAAGVRWPEALEQVVQQAREAGQTALLVALHNRFLGLLLVTDEIAEESERAVADLKGLDLRLVMLSGDKRRAAEAVAAAVGLEQVRAEVKPADKQQAVREFQEQGEIVAMVGDGINDAPALAAADLGIAIGSGADVAIESADIVLVRQQLGLVPRSIALARRTRRTIQQNLAWAFIYNITLIPLAAGLLLPWGLRLAPAWAAAAMAASSVSVVLNSLRLRRA